MGASKKDTLVFLLFNSKSIKKTFQSGLKDATEDGLGALAAGLTKRLAPKDLQVAAEVNCVAPVRWGMRNPIQLSRLWTQDHLLHLY